MAIDFTAASQRVNFGAISALANLANKTVTAWVYPDTIDAVSSDAIVTKDYLDEPNFKGWNFLYYSDSGTNKIYYGHWYSGTSGTWTADDDITAGAWQHVSVTYAVGAANDPTFYRNGIQVTTDTETTSSGDSADDTTYTLNLGGNQEFSGYSMDGRLQDVRIYNRILSADEIYALYTSRRINYLRYGLVFHAPLIGAAGCTKFDGTTLGATNYLKDIAGGVQGPVVGAPVGAGNVIQRVY